jgi:hypothetical protein
METAINYTIGILGLILAVVGIYLTVKSNRKKELVVSIKSNNIISATVSSIEKLTILYKDFYHVENLTISKVLIYNSGTETITREDLETINHLNITNKLGLLDASVLQSNYESNNIEISPLDGDTNTRIIKFDYLDKGQGAVIQTIHIGTSSDDLEIGGAIKGIHKVVEVHPDRFENYKPLDRKGKIIGIICSVIAIVFWWLFFLRREVFFETNSFLVTIGLSLGFFASAIPLSVMSVFLIRLFKRIDRVPDGLEKFLE